MTTQPGYNAVAPQVDLPALEHDVLAFWRDNDTFSKSLAQTADGPRWTFYEGPPTANGKPGVHHVQARAYKDLFPRYFAAGVHRIQATSLDGYDEVHRWLRALGLEREAVLPAFGRNGEDFVQFAKVKR